MPVSDIKKLQREGLQVDLEKFAREGYQSIPKDDHYRLKMHGICAQRHEGFFMMRLRISGGQLNPQKMERIADLARDYASGYVHLTTRQNIELHSVKIENVPEILRKLAEVGVTTRASCGHTFRNIITSPCAGSCPSEIIDTRPWVQAIAKLVVNQADYYIHRLHKRLNVSLANCTSCENHALVNDIGLTAVKNERGEVGFSLHIGGSMGVTAKHAVLLEGFLPLKDVLPALKTVAHLYILHGGNAVAAKARLKFLVEEWGVEKFREEFRKVLPTMYNADPDLPKGFVPESWDDFDPLDGLVLDFVPEGVEVQKQKGFYRVPLFVPLGEVHHSHFRQLAQWAQTGCYGKVMITREQNLELQWVSGSRVHELLGLAEQMGLPAFATKSILDIQSCPGTSFCSLAITNSQSAAGDLLRYFREKKVLTDPDLKGLRVSISGCPNSCTQYQGADIGFSGGMVKVGEDQRFAYQLYMGGEMGIQGQIGMMGKRAIADEMIVSVTDALLSVYKRDKGPSESYRKFLKRLTISEVVKRLDAVLIERGLSPTTYNRVNTSPMVGLRVIPGG